MLARLLGRKKEVSLSPIISSYEKTTEALNALQFLLREEKSLAYLGKEMQEFEIILDKYDEYLITFLTHIDFAVAEKLRDNALTGSEQSKLFRPVDEEKKVARVCVNGGPWTQVYLYEHKQLVCHKEVSFFKNLKEGKRWIA